MNYEGFDYKKIDDYSAQAKAMWGRTGAYGEFEKKAKGRTAEEAQALAGEMMALFTKVGTLRDQSPESEAVQAWVAELQNFITEHYYTCTRPMLKVLGEMYAGGGSMTENIDGAGGKGTGEFAKAAIDIYCAG